MRLSVLACVLVPALATAATARGAASKSSPWLEALSSAFVVVDMADGDIDGDGKNETVVCYQQNADDPFAAGGVAILRESGAGLMPAYHVRLDSTWCEQVQVRGRKVGILLKSSTLDKKNAKLVWEYGKDIAWTGDKGHPLYGIGVKTTSKKRGNSASMAFDGRLSTSWAEGEAGTGIGETITVRLREPVDVAYIGIYGGHGSGSRAYFDHNRVHRASLEAKTKADLGDEGAGIDFSDLGIDSMGDRIEFSLENRPQVTYVRVDKRAVTEIEIRLDSVFLGKRYDDTHIAEIEIVPRLKLSETLDRARPLNARRPKATKAPSDKKAPAPEKPSKGDTGDDTLDALDAQGGSFIPDEDI
jgi:hypothetical protein